ncbi:MAG TPA: TIR domain-containing protein [Sphingomicrobium sp.]|nr:TIR domain-containing protein [Sphingomicrobium sp.]
MSDVFVSYARADEPQAKRVADALRGLGYGVWRDDELPAHRPYSEVIEERLRSAKAVVVMWSAEAAKSQWVRAEADAARSAGTLVQALLDGNIPPLPFNQIQCADLSGWAGDADAPGWKKLLASVAALAGNGGSKDSIAPRRRRISVCVLPFQNMSGDPEQEYFSDGISEDITTDLSKISSLEVIARNTAFTFKGQAVDVADVARKLCVSHVLEGSVRKAGGRVRVTAQLIDGAGGGHVWADRYDRDLTDIFAIQDEISNAIVEALKVQLLPQEKEAIGDRCTCNADAYNLYLMARQAWITGDFGDRRREEKVIRICKRAVELDSGYAPAWALMGLAQANLHHGFAEIQGNEDGSAAAERALALDPDIAEAHLPKAWRLAEEGRHDEANAEIELALKLAPDSWEVNKEAARLFYRQRRLEDAARHLEKATEVMEADYHGMGMLFAYYHSKDDIDSALRVATKTVEQCEKALSRDPDNGAALAFGAMALARLGKVEQGRDWMERALLVDPDNFQMRYNLAWGLNKIFGEPKAAIEMLRPVMENAGANIIRLAANDPNLDNLRTDPQFEHMLAEARQRVEVTPSPPAAGGAQSRS